MIHGISSIRFVACQSRNNFASTGRQGFKVVGGRVFTGTWFHSPVYLNTSGKMEMYLDDSSSERKIIWHILKVGIPLELLKPPPASSLPGARPRGGRTARSRQGVARAPWCQVKRFLLERRTGLIEDLPKSIPMFDFFFFFLWIKEFYASNFWKYQSVSWLATMKIEKCILKVDLYCKNSIINITCFIFL